MTPENFTQWLQGYFEVSQATKLNEKEAKIIQDKLQSVFQKETSADGSGLKSNNNLTINGTTGLVTSNDILIR